MTDPQRAAKTLLVLATLCLGCGDEVAEVEVKTFVGESYAQNDPLLARKAALEVFETAMPEIMGTKAAKPRIGAPQTVHPPNTKAELDDLVIALRKGPLDELAGPARRLAAADPSLWPTLHELMLADRKAPKGDYRSLLAAIGGDVPNKYGYFARAWKKAHGFDIKLSKDWFEDLLVLPRSKVSPALLKVYRDCVLQTALFRAASDIGKTKHTEDIVATLLDAGYSHQGTFRDEVGRALAAVGDEAIPHLIIESIPPSTKKRDAEKPEVKRAQFAEHTLDKMDRLHPARATTAVREEPRLLAATLGAYARARPGEAAVVLLDYSNDRSPVVRAAARTAFLEYVNGPAPKVAGRTVRLLGGGVGKALAYLNYRERARLAIRGKVEVEAPALLEPECELQKENGKPNKPCEGQPLRLAQAFFSWLDLQRELDESTKIDAALSDPDPVRGAAVLDRLLAESPDLSSKDRLATFYDELAQTKLDEADPAAAAALWRKASVLAKPHDPVLATNLHIRALQTEAELPELPLTGRRMLLDRAVELGATPSAALSAAGPSTPAGGPIGRSRLFGGAGLVCVALFALGLLASPVRRRLLA